MMGISSSETVATLGRETIYQLQQLIQINIDSAKGFQEAAEAIDDKTLAADFRVWASDRTRQADELARYIELNAEESPAEKSWRASFREMWLKVQAALNAGNPYVVLIEMERSEDHIKGKYEETLREIAGSAVTPVLQRQYTEVKAVHDRVRNLRDARMPA